jgi:uncharacterized protein YycO
VSHQWKSVASELADGDLVFRTGRDLMSQLVLSQGDVSRFSHVGVVLKNQSGLVVVHALPRDGASPGGVRVEPLAKFADAENASDIGFYRVKGIDADASGRIREYVLSQVGKPFDDDFRMSEDGKLYCTELVLRALSAAGHNVAASIPTIQVMSISEPVVPPDYMRRLAQMEILVPGLGVQAGLVR